jgi:hypothetical protein
MTFVRFIFAHGANHLVLQGHILRLVTVGDWAADERCRSGHLCGEQIPVRCPSENARRQNQAAGGKYMIS